MKKSTCALNGCYCFYDRFRVCVLSRRASAQREIIIIKNEMICEIAVVSTHSSLGPQAQHSTDDAMCPTPSFPSPAWPARAARELREGPVTSTTDRIQ